MASVMPDFYILLWLLSLMHKRKMNHFSIEKINKRYT